MRFEWDPAKSAANKAKHGIDFTTAEALWNDPDCISAEARFTTEPRFQTIGRIDDTIWTATWTTRHDDTTIRLISVRHARDYEEARYRATADD